MPAGMTELVFAAAWLAEYTLTAIHPPRIFCGSPVSERRFRRADKTRFGAIPFAAASSHSNIRIIKSPPKVLPHASRQLLYSHQRQTVKMAPSNLPAIFNPTQQDVEMLLAAQCHLGSKNLQVHMEPYLWKTRPDGVNVLNIGKTWEKIVLAARIIVAIDNPADGTFGRASSRYLDLNFAQI